MESCARCGHELGIGRYCLNCGHPIGAPVPADAHRAAPVIDVTYEDSHRPTWLPWALGALLLVILLAVLASCLGGDDDRDDEAGTTEMAPTEAAPTGPATDLTNTVQVTAPAEGSPTQDLDGELVTYEAAHLIDGVPATAWRTPGDATGKMITFRIDDAVTVRRVGLINGYAKQVASETGVVDWYPHNRRITAVEWAFDDGTTLRQDLRQKPTLQRLTVDPITTSSIELRILAVTAPGPGSLGRDYTAISDILIAGTPAG